MIENQGEVLLFDCPFDDEADEYPDHYRVVRLDPSELASLDQASWKELAARGSVVGQVSTDRVRFDPTRRAAVHAAILSSY